MIHIESQGKDLYLCEWIFIFEYKSYDSMLSFLCDIVPMFKILCHD